jgi:hypothetical protein
VVYLATVSGGSLGVPSGLNHPFEGSRRTLRYPTSAGGSVTSFVCILSSSLTVWSPHEANALGSGTSVTRVDCVGWPS